VTLTPRVARYDQLLLDLDGCLWIGDEALEGAAEAVAALREAGKAVAFLTNDVRHTPEEFVRKLWRLGFQAALSEVVTVGSVVQYLLSPRDGGAAYVVGSLALVEHVAEAGLRIVNRTEFASRADVVVVGAHEDLTFEELRIATQAVLRGAQLIGATRDATFPMPDGPWPGTGSIVAAVEAATGVRARNVGKPDAELFRTALDRLGPGRALAVGDRLDADVGGARAAGIDGAIVFSGSTTPAEVHAVMGGPTRPALTAPTLADLVLA
jgi:HAD superfamily hydrolase (TIGR01450 family)